MYRSRSFASFIIVVLLIVLLVVLVGRANGPGALGGTQNVLQIDHLNAPQWADGLWDGFVSLIGLIAMLIKPAKYDFIEFGANRLYYLGFYIGAVIQAGILYFGGIRIFH